MLSPLPQMDSTRRHEDLRAKLKTCGFEARAEDRADAGCLELTLDLPTLPNTRLLELEDIRSHVPVRVPPVALADGQGDAELGGRLVDRPPDALPERIEWGKRDLECGVFTAGLHFLNSGDIQRDLYQWRVFRYGTYR